MDEYISRKRLIDDFTGPGGITVYGKYIPAIVSRINVQPAADVEPVVHAKWIVQEKGYGDKVAICSHCRENAVDLQEEDRGHGYNLVYHRPALTKRCPNCGARMDKEESNNESSADQE